MNERLNVELEELRELERRVRRPSFPWKSGEQVHELQVIALVASLAPVGTLTLWTLNAFGVVVGELYIIFGMLISGWFGMWMTMLVVAMIEWVNKTRPLYARWITVVELAFTWLPFAGACAHYFLEIWSWLWAGRTITEEHATRAVARRRLR